jgi:hypothetical protein
MVDPLMAHLPVQVNSWKDQMVRQALAPLHGLAEETGAAVLVVAHLNKGQGTDPLHRLGGSIGIPAAARSVLLLGRSRVPRRAGARFSLTRGGLTLERLALQHRHTSNADLAIDLHQAAFNGQLHQIAKELDATFDQRRFVYEARWDPEHEWMDIGSAHCRRTPSRFRASKSTSSSTRTRRPARRREQFELEAARAGLRVESWWTDCAGDFAVALATSDLSAGG